MVKLFATLLLISADLTGPAAANDIIHADLPLFLSEQDGIWPRPFNSAEAIGCAHSIKLGDWQFDAPRDDGLEWIRFTNYGVIHCYIIESRGYARERLGAQGFSYSFMVALGQADGRDGRVDLWALQSGARPGSNYLLLARKPDAEGHPIAAFDVLRTDCPQRNVRETLPIDILATRYCAINTRDELVALARSMAKRRPLGRLQFIGPAPDE